MSAQQSRHSAEETDRRGDEIYERTIRAQVEATHYGKVVAIDIETGAYAVDELLLLPPGASAPNPPTLRCALCVLAIAPCTTVAGIPSWGVSDLSACSHHPRPHPILLPPLP